MNPFYFVGGAVCHQLLERTIYVDKIPLAYCARCTGIYMGIVLTFVYFVINRRMDGDKPLEGFQILLVALAFLPFMVDGLGSYLGFWQSNNLLRILSGLPAGISLPYFFILCRNIDSQFIGTRPIYKDLTEQIIIIAAGFLVVLAIYFNLINYIIVSVMLMLGMLLFMCFAINMLLNAITKNRLSGRKGIYCTVIITVFCILGSRCLRVWLKF